MKLAWHFQGLSIVYASCVTAWAFIGFSAAEKLGLKVPLGVTARTALMFCISYIVLRSLLALYYYETDRIKDHLEKEATKGGT